MKIIKGKVVSISHKNEVFYYTLFNEKIKYKTDNPYEFNIGCKYVFIKYFNKIYTINLLSKFDNFNTFIFIVLVFLVSVFVQLFHDLYYNYFILRFCVTLFCFLFIRTGLIKRRVVKSLNKNGVNKIGEICEVIGNEGISDDITYYAKVKIKDEVGNSGLMHYKLGYNLNPKEYIGKEIEVVYDLLSNEIINKNILIKEYLIYLIFGLTFFIFSIFSEMGKFESFDGWSP